MSTPANSADEVFGQVRKNMTDNVLKREVLWDESKHHRNQGKFARGAAIAAGSTAAGAGALSGYSHLAANGYKRAAEMHRPGRGFVEELFADGMLRHGEGQMRALRGRTGKIALGAAGVAVGAEALARHEKKKAARKTADIENVGKSANSADEVFSKLTQFDESKHHRNHGQFSSNGGGGRDHWAGLKHGAGVGARLGAVLGGVPSALAGAGAGGFAAHQATHLGSAAPGALSTLGHDEEAIAQLKRMSALSGGKKAAVIGGAAAVTGLTSGVMGALHSGATGGVLGGAIGAAVGRERKPKSREESQAFVEGAKAAHEHNHGKDDGVSKNYVSNDVEEVFKSARGIVKPVSDALNGVGNTIQGAAKNPKGAAKAAWKTADVVSRNPKVAMGVGLGVAGAGAAGAYHHLKKNDDVSSDVAELFAKAREMEIEKGIGGLVDAEKIGAAATKVKTAVTDPVNRAAVKGVASFHATNALNGAKKLGTKINGLSTGSKIGLGAAAGVGAGVGLHQRSKNGF